MRRPRIFGAGLLATALLAPACLAPDAVPGGTTTGAGGTGGAPIPLDWAHSYGIDFDADQRAFSVAAMPDGDAIVAGYFEGSLTIGSLPSLPNTAGRDAFVFSLDPAGAPHWVAGFSGSGDQMAHRAVAAEGEGVFVAGSFSESLVYDGDEMGDSPSGKDGFLARLDGQRKLLWLLRASGDGDQTLQSVVAIPGGDSIVCGTSNGTLDLGGAKINEVAPGDDEIFIARIDAAGKPKWARSLRGDAQNLDPWPACFVALAADGTLRVAGTFSGAVELDEDLGAIGSHDLFVGALSPTGAPLWGHALGSPGVDQRVASLDVTPAGDALISGDLRGKVTFGGATLESEGDRPDAFLAVYDPSGAVTWARRYGSSAEDHAASAAFDASQNIHFAGQFRGAIDFTGEPPLLNSEASAGADDIFLAILDPDHEPLGAASFGGPDAQVATSLAVDASGNTLLTGWFRDRLDLGSGPLDAQNGDDIFIARFTK